MPLTLAQVDLESGLPLTPGSAGRAGGKPMLWIADPGPGPINVPL